MRAFHAIQKKGFTVVVMLIIFGVFMVMQPVTAQAGKGGTPEELQKQIDELKAQVATLTAALDAERAAREAQDTYLLGEIDAVTVPQSLLDLAPYVSVNPDAMNEINGPNVVFSGVNVHIQSGAGYTWDYSHGPLTGLGNLIMGYNELRGTGYGDNRSGSHNIVLGVYNNFSSYGGLVGGNWNTISGKTSSVLTGNENAASGECSIVFGGEQNTASAYASSISGGLRNEASSSFSSVSGGQENKASGPSSSVSGGYKNEASLGYSSVSGGQENKASAAFSSVSGGYKNEASYQYGSVSGGQENKASGLCSSVSGGYNHVAGYQFDWAAGSLWEDE